MPISPKTRQQIINHLLPHCGAADQRLTLIDGAFFGTDVGSKLQLEGAPADFTSRTVDILIAHGDLSPGNPAVIHLLNALPVGDNRKSEITDLIAVIRVAAFGLGHP